MQGFRRRYGEGVFPQHEAASLSQLPSSPSASQQEVGNLRIRVPGGGRHRALTPVDPRARDPHLMRSLSRLPSECSLNDDDHGGGGGGEGTEGFLRLGSPASSTETPRGPQPRQERMRLSPDTPVSCAESRHDSHSPRSEYASKHHHHHHRQSQASMGEHDVTPDYTYRGSAFGWGLVDPTSDPSTSSRTKQSQPMAVSKTNVRAMTQPPLRVGAYNPWFLSRGCPNFDRTATVSAMSELLLSAMPRGKTTTTSMMWMKESANSSSSSAVSSAVSSSLVPPAIPAPAPSSTGTSIAVEAMQLQQLLKEEREKQRQLSAQLMRDTVRD